MLQINVQPYASDALEDAMRLAQTKALNSFTFSDCLNYLNYAWSDIYSRIACIDAGYYSKVVRLTDKITHLPPYVKNTVKVFRAQTPTGHGRTIYRASGYNDIDASGTYHISGTELYCRDATSCNIWLEFVPACPFITFTKNNRDPKIYTEYTQNTGNNIWNMWRIVINDSEDWPEDFDEVRISKMELVHRNTAEHRDITSIINKDGYRLVYMKCDYPYIFVSYQKVYMNGDSPDEYVSGFYDKDLDFVKWNGFDFTGRETNVKLLDARYNDKTGMGVVLADYGDLHKDEDMHDMPTIKELGWTPDTKLVYPAPEMYRYLVARLADKFSALNESNVMGVQKELTEAKYAFEAFIAKDKSAWQRIDNVNSSTITDYII